MLPGNKSQYIASNGSWCASLQPSGEAAARCTTEAAHSAGAGNEFEGNYLVDDGLGECLTHVVRFLGELVGEEVGDAVVERACLLSHRFPTGHYGVMWGGLD